MYRKYSCLFHVYILYKQTLVYVDENRQNRHQTVYLTYTECIQTQIDSIHRIDTFVSFFGVDRQQTVYQTYIVYILDANRQHVQKRHKLFCRLEGILAIDRGDSKSYTRRIFCLFCIYCLFASKQTGDTSSIQSSVYSINSVYFHTRRIQCILRRK